MKPTFIDRGSFLVMGTSTRVAPECEGPEKYGSIWNEFESHHAQIEPYSTDGAYYGVSFAVGEGKVCDYLAGMAVEQVGSIPEGLVLREVPAARYAVFACPMEAIGETYRFAFGEWLPSSPYHFSGAAPAFEQYPPEEDESSPVLVHIPIVEKGTAAG